MNLNDWKNLIAWLAGIFIVVSTLVVLLPLGRDNTDPGWPGRSGMRLHIDAATGCEYLSNPGGGITPRVNSKGSHMGCLTN